MDPQSVAANFNLLQDGKLPVPGVTTWDEYFTQMEYQPDDLLVRRDTTYSLSLGGGAQARGGTPLDAPMAVAYVTVPDLTVVSSDPAQGGTKHAYQSLILN